jgi:hypothetical protein
MPKFCSCTVGGLLIAVKSRLRIAGAFHKLGKDRWKIRCDDGSRNSYDS